jgi:hypothetical protein
VQAIKRVGVAPAMRLKSDWFDPDTHWAAAHRGCWRISNSSAQLAPDRDSIANEVQCQVLNESTGSGNSN